MLAKLDAQSIFVIASVGALIGLLYYKGKKKLAKKIILGLVIRAEEIYGSGKGKIKYLNVVKKVYPRLPWIVRTFMTEEMLDDYIEEAVEQLEKILDTDQTKEES